MREMMKWLAVGALMVLLSACSNKTASNDNNITTVDTTPPTFTSSATATVPENQTDAITLKATDDSTPITYSISGGDSASFNVDSSSGKVTFKTAPDYETKNKYTFTAKATDAKGNTATQGVTINISDVDEIPPTFTSSPTITVPENQTDAITLQATDTSTPITYSISGGDSASFNVDSSSGVVTFNRAPDFETKNKYTFTAKATDAVGNKATQSVTINISDVDDTPPTFTSSATATVPENQTYAITLKATDDSTPITYSISGGDSDSFNINSSSGKVTFKTAPDYETKNKYTFTAKATDAKGNTATQGVTINVSDINNSTSIAQLGNLAGAEVKIYKIEDNGTRALLYTGTTSSGDKLYEIGKFNNHSQNLDDDTYYLYVVKGGKDWDSDDDGVKDANFTANKGVIRAIAKGSNIKQAGDDFGVTAVSELLYERVHRYLVANFDKNSFENYLEQETKKVLTDATIDDILTFDPVNDKENLSKIYKDKYIKTINFIHQGKIPLLNFSTKLGSYDTARWAWRVTLSSDGTKAYVADDDNGLVVIDISDPTNPTKLGLYDTAGRAYGVTLSSDGIKAYVADYDNGLVVIDISDPTNPTKLGSYDTAGYAAGVTLSSDGKKAYVADWNNGLVVIDISDPTNPTKIGSYDTAGYAWGVTLSSDGSKAYVADGYNGLVVIDISDPTNPTKLGSYDTAGRAYGVTLSSDGKKAYVADGYNGLVVIDVSLIGED